MDTLRYNNLNESGFSNKENQKSKYAEIVHTNRLEIRKNKYSDEVNHLYDIFLLETNKKIGWINLIEDDLDEYIEIWYSVLKRYRNQGICTEAVEALIINNSHKSFYISTWTSNRPSMKVCHKLEEKLKKYGFNCHFEKSLSIKFFFEKI